MNRVTITAGIGEDRHGKPIPAAVREAALKAIREHVAREAGGYTETTAQGGWIAHDGRLVQEPSVRFVILADDDGARFARYIGRALGQDTVVMETEPTTAQFIETGAELVEAMEPLTML